MTEFRSNASKLIAADIASGQDAQDLFDSIYRGVEASAADKAMLTLSACRSLRIMLDGGMSQVNIKTSFPKSASYVSKGHTVTALFAEIVSGDLADGHSELVSNLQTFATLAGCDVPVTTMATDFLSDTGTVHAAAVETIYSTFGSLEYVYNVAKGNRLHADDPRNNDDDDSGDDSGDDQPTGDDDDSGDSPKVSGEELIARGVRKMRESGATDQAIADYFMSVIGS